MTKKTTLRPPVSYQGGKQRLSKEIVDIILGGNAVNKDTLFYDLCSGSGAISLELVNRGVASNNIIMVDNGVFGAFWKVVSEDEFDVEVFYNIADQIPQDRHIIHDFFKKEASEPIDDLYIYKYLFLQAASFGGKQIWIEENQWKHHSFRNYWQPTETSSRRSPVNPMQPMTDTIVSRVKKIIDSRLRFEVLNDDIYNILNQVEHSSSNCIFYIDPPYKNTLGYENTFDWEDFIQQLMTVTSAPIYVSECNKYSDDAILLNINNKKGGINGKKRGGKKEEWLNIFK